MQDAECAVCAVCDPIFATKPEYGYNCPMLRAFFAILTVTSVFVLVSCSTKPSNANVPTANIGRDQKENSAKTNSEELALLINLPFETEDIAWQESPDHARITAVMRFSPADAAKIVAEAERINAPTPVRIPMETWFPTEVIAQSEISGDDTVSGNSYPANMFFQPPFSTGTITHIENSDYFVLELSTK